LVLFGAFIDQIIFYYYLNPFFVVAVDGIFFSVRVVTIVVGGCVIVFEINLFLMIWFDYWSGKFS
jgi:hypothetical protein